MSVFLQPIFTQTVGSGGAASVTFNNIPQGYTDLVVKISARTSYSAALQIVMTANSDSSSLYSTTYLYGSGSATSSSRQSATYWLLGNLDNSTQTSNTFASIECYLPNYTSSNYKQMTVDSITENNATAADQWMIANLYRSTSAISSLSIGCFGQTILQYSSFSLYGVLRQGI